MKTLILTSIILILAVGILNTPAQDRSAGIGKSFKGPIGLQLYSLRDQFKKDVPGTLDEVKKFGFKYVELAGTYDMKPSDFKAELDKRGLQAISGHFPYDRYQNDLDGIGKEAKALGLKYVGCAWIPHEGKFDEKKCREVIQVFNHAGEELAKKGFKFFYHTHGYEFQPFGDGTLFDLLVQQTHPAYVRFEMDIFWIVNPGQNPVELFKKYRGRFELTHLKDMKKGTPTGADAPVAGVNDDVALGAGQMDMAAILKAAQQSGVKWNFLEDESNVSEKQIPESLKYLEHVKF